MTLVSTGREELAAYARHTLRAESIYRGYKPRTAVLDRLVTTLRSARVVVVSGDWCADCRREVPKLARIMEALPEDWTAELRGDDPATRDTLNVLAIPTFLVLDAESGRELGRIVESPVGDDGIEGDLLEIARHTAEAD